MYADVPKDVPTHLLADPESKITKIGRFLRVTLDGFSEHNAENLVKFMTEANKAYLAATETKGCD